MSNRIDPLFGALIEGSDWFPSPAHVLRRAAILEIVSDLRPGRMIDMGCGAGRWLADWGRLGHSGIGVEPDADARALSRACVSAVGANFDLTAAAQDTPETFDHMAAIEVLEHLENPLDHLRDWFPLLRAGGTFVASVPTFQRLWGASDEWAGHVQRFEPEEFCQLIRDAGFQIEASRLYGYPLGNLTRFVGNRASAAKRRRRNPSENERMQATLASGRDRSIERRVGPLLQSWPARMVLRAGIMMQRHFRRRGIGIIVLAQKPGPKTI
jgi:SAM-dependent methyltransferase